MESLSIVASGTPDAGVGGRIVVFKENLRKPERIANPNTQKKRADLSTGPNLFVNPEGLITYPNPDRR
jgi:hypothetical protein